MAVFIIKKGVQAKEPLSLRNFHFIEASDLFLKEIESKVCESIDFNKDKQEIQRLLQKFEDIEREVHFIEEISKSLVDIINQEKNHNSEQKMDGKIMSRIVVLNNDLKEFEKLLSLISEIKDRKIKVDQRLKDLGIKVCFKYHFYYNKILIKFKKRVPNGYQYLF